MRVGFSIRAIFSIGSGKTLNIFLMIDDANDCFLLYVTLLVFSYILSAIKVLDAERYLFSMS
jgi:hypothetical protein